MSSISNKIKNCYIKRNISNIHYFIIFVSVLSFGVICYENSFIFQSSNGQSAANNLQNQNNINSQTSNPTDNSFIISGPLSSFLSTPSGNWVVSGNWTLEVLNGNLSNFNANMQWDPTNLTKLSHSHNFVNFRVDPHTQSIFLGPERIIDIKGIMDIGANNKIEWVNVPAEIKTTGNTITISILNDSKTGNHFNNYPIFGKIGKVSQVNANVNNPLSNNIQANQQPIQTQANQQPIIPSHQSTNSFKMEGIIDSIIYTPSGSKWNTAGGWTLVVDNGKVAIFNINTTWQNATDSHTHEFLNFKSKAKNIVLKPTNDLSIKGTMDVGTNNRISWPSVPTTVNIASGKTITISVDDSKTNHHFANQPIHGIVNKLTLCSNTPVSNMQVLPRCT